MRIEIWSDIACPWCYVGKRNLEAALADFDHADEVELVWRSFELDPSAPYEREGAYAGHLAAKYRSSPEDAQAMIDRMAETGAAAGVELRFDRVRSGNTFDAHRLLHHARHRGAGGAMKERLMRAYLTEGVLMSDVHELRRLAVEVGLDEDEVVAVLSAETYAEDVREEESTAHDLGAGGVPFFVVDRRFALGGAQPPATLLQVLQQAWEAGHPTLTTVPADAPAPGCGEDGCAI